MFDQGLWREASIFKPKACRERIDVWRFDPGWLGLMVFSKSSLHNWGPDDVIPDDDTLSQPGARTFHCLCCWDVFFVFVSKSGGITTWDISETCRKSWEKNDQRNSEASTLASYSILIQDIPLFGKGGIYLRKMEEIPNNHLGCIVNWWSPDFWTINSSINYRVAAHSVLLTKNPLTHRFSTTHFLEMVTFFL